MRSRPSPATVASSRGRSGPPSRSPRDRATARPAGRHRRPRRACNAERWAVRRGEAACLDAASGWRRGRGLRSKLDRRSVSSRARRGRQPVGARSTATTTEFLIVGSHIDAVPDGGWLDGALGLMTALETVRQLARAGTRPPIGVRFVDWADEEGARFGRSLLGSSACAGTLVPDDVRDLRDADGVTLGDALAACDVDLDRAPAAAERLDGAVALPRAPHRAGAGAARRRSAGLRGERDRRGRAAPDDVHRSGRARRLDADAAAPGLARRRGAGGARDSARARSTTAASARSGGCTPLPA